MLFRLDAKAEKLKGEMATLCSLCNSRVSKGTNIYTCRICNPWHNVCDDCATGKNDALMAIKSVSEATPVDLKLADAHVDPHTLSEGE